MTPIKAIRKYCVEFCMNNQPGEVRLCTSSECSLYNYRLGRTLKKSRLTSLKSIKVRCIDCATSAIEANLCKEKNCQLYEYRNGHNPSRKGIGGNIGNFNKGLVKISSYSK